MGEKLSPGPSNSGIEKTERPVSSEKIQKDEPQLPARIDDPAVIETQIEEIIQSKSRELEGLRSAYGALGLTPPDSSAALSAYESGLHSLRGLHSRVSRIDKVGATSAQNVSEMSTQTQHQRRLDELLQNLLGRQEYSDQVDVPVPSDKPRLEGRRSGNNSASRLSIEDQTMSTSNALPQEYRKTAHNAARELLSSLKKVQAIVGQPSEAQRIEMMHKGIPFTDTVARLENFLKTPSGSNERPGIIPTIRQYFLELGPEETIRRAKEASPAMLERVAENIKTGNLHAVVEDMESLDPLYKQAIRVVSSQNNNELYALHRLRASLGSDVLQIVKRITKMNEGH